MAANAPYYQMGSGQFIATTSTIAPSRFASDDEYEPSSAAVTSSNAQIQPADTERTASQTPADTPVNMMEENHNLANLLEAATTAAGQAAQAMDSKESGVEKITAHGPVKRKRSSSPDVQVAAVTYHQADRPIAPKPKRRRVEIPTDPQLQSCDADMRSPPENTKIPPSPSGETLLNDARAAGVHSAAALFRRSTEKTARKYTRPPMSKLFMSLQLSPENFLQLQAQTKTYMLDPAHPERQSCVGNRGKGDTDMVKLRLFNCVRDFLNDGVGEEFFGENVEKPGERDALEAARALGQEQAVSSEERLTWPRDGNKIISLVTPLMRRMVTNERQRMYAIETRKGGSKKAKEGSAEALTQQTSRSPSGNRSRGPSPNVVTPITPSQTQTANVAQSPTNAPVSITNINIFLVLASGSKLDELRIPPGPLELATYPWDSFSDHVTKLLQRNKLLHHTDNLRNLAAAANAIQGDGAIASTTTETIQAPSNGAVSHHVPQANETISGGQSTNTEAIQAQPNSAVPQHIIKTVGPNGWEVIETGEQWNDLLLRRGREIWADGIINMVVEVDV